MKLHKLKINPLGFIFSTILTLTIYYNFERKLEQMNRFLLLAGCFLPFFVSGQGLQLKLQLKQAAGEKVYLAHYYLNNIYVDDSVQLNDSGKGIFRRDSLLHQGLYKIYVNKNKHFDFLLGADQHFKLTNTSFSIETARAAGAVETEEFLAYMHFLNRINNKGTLLRKKVKTAVSDDEKSAIKDSLEILSKQLVTYGLRVQKKYPDSFISKFLLANYVPEPEISDFPEKVQQNDSLLLLARFYYQQKHFWDYFDYTDERFLYTPFFKPKLETWFKKALFQRYDSVRGPVFNLIEEVKPYPRIFQFITSWFTNTTVNSNIMGMDALFIDLAKIYYLSGEAFWASDITLKSIRENVMFIQNNLIGEKAPDFTMETFDGEFVNLNETEAKFLIVLIYEPNCSHCRKFVPKFYNEVYQKYKEKGLKTFAIYSMDDRKEWSDFLIEHKLFDWINVWDPENTTNFKILYDARETPGVYVLNENKTIVAKKLSLNQIKEMLKKAF